MRISMAVTSLAPSGGVERVALDDGRALAAMGHVIDVYYSVPGLLQDEYIQFASQLRQLGVLEFDRQRPLRTAVSLARSIARARGDVRDVLYVHRTANIEWGVAVALRGAAPLICHVHGLGGPRRQRLVKLIEPHVAKWIAVSDFVKNFWISAGIPHNQIHTILNGVDPELYPAVTSSLREQARVALRLPQDAFVVTFFGRVTEVKGIFPLMRAWDELFAEHSDMHLVILGPVDPLIEQRFEAWRSGAKRVTWIPMRDNPQAVVAAADVVAVPSVWDEPCSRAITESVMMGLPVITTCVGGSPEIVPAGLADLMCAPGDAHELAEKIRYLYSNGTLRAALEKECRAFAEERLSLRRHVSEVEEILTAAAR